MNTPQGCAYPDMRLEVFAPVFLRWPIRMLPLRVAPELVGDQELLGLAFPGPHRGPVIRLQFREQTPVAAGKSDKVGRFHGVNYLPARRIPAAGRTARRRPCSACAGRVRRCSSHPARSFPRSPRPSFPARGSRTGLRRRRGFRTSGRAFSVASSSREPICGQLTDRHGPGPRGRRPKTGLVIAFRLWPEAAFGT